MSKDVNYELHLNGGGKFEDQLNHLKSGASALDESFGSLKRQIIEAFAVREIYNFGKEILNVTAEFQGFENVIKYSSLNEKDAGANLDYLKDAVVRLHLPMKETYESFSEMQAGMLGTGIEGKKLIDLFEGITEASATLHMNPQKLSQMTFALKEVGELGTLQARQLRMMSFALPGSGELAAEAMKMSSAQLHEAMHKGAIKSSEFLQKFGDKLREHFGSGVKAFGQSLIGNMNDTKNATIKLMLDMGDKLEPVFLSIMKGIRDVVGEFKKLFDFLYEHKKTIKDVAYYIVELAAASSAYLIILKGIKLYTVLSTYAYGAYWVVTEGLTGATLQAAYATGSLGTAMKAIPIMFAVGAFALLIDEIRKWKEIIGDNAHATDFFMKKGLDEETTHVQELTEQYMRLHKVKKEIAESVVFKEQKELVLGNISALKKEISDWNPAAPHFKEQVEQHEAMKNQLANEMGKAGYLSSGSGGGVKDKGNGIKNDITLSDQSSQVSGTKQVIINVQINKLVELLKIEASNIKDGLSSVVPDVGKALTTAVTQFSASQDI